MPPSLLAEATTAHRAGHLNEAEAKYRAQLTITPHDADALALLGVLLDDKGSTADGLGFIEQAIAMDGNAALFRFYFGNAQMKRGIWPLAVNAFRETVRLAPDFTEAWLRLSFCAEKNADYETAAAAGEKAIALAPGNAAGYLAYGAALSRMERHEDAVEVFKNAVRQKPDHIASWDALGLEYLALNRLDDAETIFRTMIEIAKEQVDDAQLENIDTARLGASHWHLAWVELAKGNLKQGFARYRCRLSAKGWLDHSGIKQPLWRGEDIAGKTVLVNDEGGNGDTFMAARYLPLMKARGARVILRVKPELAPLFKGWDGADHIVSYGEASGAFDYYSWALDLPFAFGTTLETIPQTIPYLPLLAPDEPTMLPDAKGKKRIGIIWAGSTENAYDKRRIPLTLLQPLFGRAGCEFYSLTRDKRPGDDALLAALPITDLAPRLRHFGDLARFIMQMDVVIGCDTAAPQLAGALGKKAWVFLPFSCDWRWLTGRGDSPWYPVMRLFRQTRSGHWDDVIEEVGKALDEECTG